MLKIKKWTLKKKTRQGVIAVLLFILVLALAGLYWSYTRPAETAVDFTAFSYSQESMLDYRVHLLPNELYEEAYLGPGRAYISALTDYISTEFIYRFSAGSEADIKGEYSATANIVALTGQEDHLVWEKSFPLLATEAFHINGKDVFLREEVILPFSEYVALANSIVETTGFSPQKLNLRVNYNVDLVADTPEGVIEETAAPELIVPLSGNVFTVGGSLEDSRTGGIPATRQEPVPYFEEARTGFSLLSTLLVLFLLIFIQVTVGREERNNFVKKKLSRILKQHQDRIVKCAEAIPSPGHGNILEVASFDDLLKIADELGKPIFYQNGLGSQGSLGAQGGNGYEYLFFVFSEQYSYRYLLGEVSLPSRGALSQRHLLHQ